MRSADQIKQQLAAKGIDSDCRRCGKDEWGLFSGVGIVPDMADDISMAGGTAAIVRVCAFCGCIELYSPGMLNR